MRAIFQEILDVMDFGAANSVKAASNSNCGFCGLDAMRVDL